MNILKEISGETDSLAPPYENGEEGTAAGTDKDYENGTNPQTEVGVDAGTRAAV